MSLFVNVFVFRHDVEFPPQAIVLRGRIPALRVAPTALILPRGIINLVRTRATIITFVHRGRIL